MKGSLKKSLGLSEYPWSSDDDEDDDPQRTTSRENFRRHSINTSQSAGGPSTARRTEPLSANTLSSGDEPQPSTSRSLSPSRRPQAERDADLLHNTHPGTSTSCTREPAPAPNGSRWREMVFGRGLREPPQPGDRQRVALYSRRLNRSFDNLRALRARYLFNTVTSQPDAVSTSPASRRAPAEAGPAPSVERADAARALEVPAAVNTPNVSANGVVLDALVELNEVPEENLNADQSDDQNERNATNDETRNGNASAAGSSQRRGVKRQRVGYDHDSETRNWKELNQSLLGLLECPVCLEGMGPPVLQCRRGHLACGACRARTAACAVCRAGYSSLRNRPMERVAELVMYPCRHGCGREVRLRGRRPHEASCALRRHACPAPACALRQQAYSRELLPLHLQCEHPAMVSRGRRHTFSVQLHLELDEHWFVAALGEVFHVRVAVQVRAWRVLVQAAYIGPQCHAARYVYRVTVEGLDSGRQMVYSRPTHSDLDDFLINLSRQDLFHLSFDEAFNFLRTDNEPFDQAFEAKPFKFTVEIIRSEDVQELGNSDSCFVVNKE